MVHVQYKVAVRLVHIMLASIYSASFTGILPTPERAPAFDDGIQADGSLCGLREELAVGVRAKEVEANLRKHAILE